MAISVDDSTVARWGDSLARTETTVSGSFTPANNSLLVCCLNWDQPGAFADESMVPSGGGWTWTKQVECKYSTTPDHSENGGASIWTAPVTSGASMQVTVTRNSTGYDGEETVSGKVYIVTGQAASPIGESSSNQLDIEWEVANQFNAGLTATGAGRLFACATDWSAQGTPTSTDTEDGGHAAGFISWVSAYKASDHASGTVNVDINGYDTNACQWNWMALEILAATAATIELEGFRFRNDDGSETTATWKANQDVNITLAANTAFRLRKILNATGDPASIDAQVDFRHKPSGGSFGSWIKVTS
jgi:predicted RNA-binding protein with TRAM domain